MHMLLYLRCVYIQEWCQCVVHVALEHSHIHVVERLLHKHFTVQQEAYSKVAFAIIHMHTFPYIYTHDTTEVSDAYVYDAYV